MMSSKASVSLSVTLEFGLGIGVAAHNRKSHLNKLDVNCSPLHKRSLEVGCSSGLAQWLPGHQGELRVSDPPA